MKHPLRKAHSFFQSSLDPLRGCINQRYYMEAPDRTLIIPPGDVMPSLEEDGAHVAPKTRADKVWRWSYQSYLAKKDRIYFAKSKRSPLIDSDGNHTAWNAYEKKYEDEETNENVVLPNDVIDGYINTLGANLLSEMRIDFSYSKPVELVRYLIEITQKEKNVKLLDFFAGSGTTLHAVMQLNAEDGGKRQCILCTNNENDICENVTYERNKRVIQGYTKPNGEHVEGLHDNNLRYYRTDFVGRSRSTKNMRRLVQLSTDMLCIKENLYAEKKSFAGLPTYKNIYRYFEHGDKNMLIIYDERYVDEIVKMIAADTDSELKVSTVETGSKIKVYLFSPSEDPWEASFEPVIDKVELCALPQAIYNAYRRILPKRRQKPIETNDEEDILSDKQDEEIGGLFAVKGGDE